MSIAFTASNSPVFFKTYNCFCMPQDDVPIPGCSDCNGTGEVVIERIEHEAQFSNPNAWPLTALFTRDGKGDHCGCIEHHNMNLAIAKLIAHQPQDHRAQALQGILTWAHANGESVSWG